MRDGSPTFEPQRRGRRSKIMTRHLQSTALFTEAETIQGVNYKRYVTKECNRDSATRAQIDAYLKEALRKQEAEAARLADGLRAVDQTARTNLPTLLDAMGEFRTATGDVQADVKRAIDAVRALDAEGKTCAYLWLRRHGAAGGYDELVARVNKTWSKISVKGKETIKRKLANFMFLLKAPKVTIAPAKGVRECPNLMIRRNRKNDFFDVITQETVDFADAFLRVRAPDATFCIPVEQLEGRGDTDPIGFTDHWGAASTRQPRTYHAKMFTFAVHLKGEFTQIDVPVFRLLRLFNVL